MPRPRWGSDGEPRGERNPAADDAARLAAQAVALVDAARGASWYEEERNAVDAAALTLCRLRRAAAGEARSPEGGDGAVREALGRASPEAVIWLASRAISHMDEHGFPEAVTGPSNQPI